ncbi:MAG: radical SAM protein [Spirochaetaceae bacterium]|nr:radical SAM protein [Spirochaetaceae bacterium]
MIAFGPVPSRRLGRSLGINNIPSKMCSYSCVYCQVGRTHNLHVERLDLFKPERIVKEVYIKIKKAQQMGETIDYITFVPNGEPTLDVNLGPTIDMLKPLGIKIAIITNGFLIWREDIRKILLKTDWISFKMDSIIEQIWHKVNRPHKCMQLNPILEGLLEFKKNYHGQLITETMLIKGINDGDHNLEAVAEYLFQLKPDKAYLSIPTRPPAEHWVFPPDEEVINKAYQIFSKPVDHVEYLIGYEGNTFTYTGSIKEDLLSITSVHPMREDAVKDFLQKASADWSVINKLISKDQLIETDYEGRKYFMRRIPEKLVI